MGAASTSTATLSAGEVEEWVVESVRAGTLEGGDRDLEKRRTPEPGIRDRLLSRRVGGVARVKDKSTCVVGTGSEKPSCAATWAEEGAENPSCAMA